jgi:SMI1 / KNR4 family (SUKH-1)
MSVEFFQRGPGITGAGVDAFAARIGRALPPDYRAFLLTYNGGRPDQHVIRNTARGDLGVKIFFGIWDREYFDIDAEYETMRDRIFSHHLSIGIDDCGNRFCLSLGPSDFGSVYFWDHEEEADEGEDPSERNLYLVANSFAEFWERMEPIDPDKYLAEQDSLDAETEDSASDSPPRTNGQSP